jgi:hypothetical protein
MDIRLFCSPLISSVGVWTSLNDAAVALVAGTNASGFAFMLGTWKLEAWIVRAARRQGPDRGIFAVTISSSADTRCARETRRRGTRVIAAKCRS